MAKGGSDREPKKRRVTRRLPPDARRGRWDLRLEEARARRAEAISARENGTEPKTSTDLPETGHAPPLSEEDRREVLKSVGPITEALPRAPVTRAPEPAHLADEDHPETFTDPAAPSSGAGQAHDGLADIAAPPPQGRPLRGLLGGIALTAAAIAALVYSGLLGSGDPLEPGPTVQSSFSLPQTTASSAEAPVGLVPAVEPPPDPREPNATLALVTNPDAPASRNIAQPPPPPEPELAVFAPVTSPAPAPRPATQVAAPVQPIVIENLDRPEPEPANALTDLQFVQTYRATPAFMPFNLGLVFPFPDPQRRTEPVSRQTQVQEIAVPPTLLLPLSPAPPRPRPGFAVVVRPASEAGTWIPRPRPVSGSAAIAQAAMRVLFEIPASSTNPPASGISPTASSLDPELDRPLEPASAETDPPAAAPAPTPSFETRLVLFAPGAVSQGGLERLGRIAESSGFSDPALRRHAINVSETQVRFFHTSDREAAASAATAYGGRVRDFTGFNPKPDPGLIEVWIAGEGTSSGATSAGASRQTRGPETAVERLLDRVVGNILR